MTQVLTANRRMRVHMPKKQAGGKGSSNQACVDMENLRRNDQLRCSKLIEGSLTEPSIRFDSSSLTDPFYALAVRRKSFADLTCSLVSVSAQNMYLFK